MKKIIFVFILLFNVNLISLNYPKDYLEALKIILKYEGGYFEEEHTKYGIMQGTYNAFRKDKKLNVRDITEITMDEVQECYYMRYWTRAGCDTLTKLLSIVHFDSVVNFGITGSNEFILFVSSMDLSDFDKSMLYIDQRIKKRYTIVEKNPYKKKFLKGWLKRDNSLKNIILKLNELK